MSTHELARGERLHQEAQAELAAARDLLNQNKERLEDTRRKMHFITEKRVSGTVTPQDSAEFAALQADESLLAKMMIQAQQAEARAVELVHGAYVYYSDASNAHRREMDTAKFKALQEKCKEIDAVFCKALGELGSAGRAIGISTLGQCYQKSDTLHRALDLNVTPSLEG